METQETAVLTPEMEAHLIQRVPALLEQGMMMDDAIELSMQEFMAHLKELTNGETSGAKDFRRNVISDIWHQCRDQH